MLAKFCVAYIHHEVEVSCCSHYTTVTSKLPSPGDSEGTLRSSNQAVTCHLFTTHDGGFSLYLFNVSVKKASCKCQFVQSLVTCQGMEPKPTDSIADALPTRRLIGCGQEQSITLMNFKDFKNQIAQFAV